MKPPVALTIAGSDSGGGAGIQADLKTFAAYDVHGLSVITSVTAQNSAGVRGSHDTPADFVGSQIDAVVEDFDVKWAKTGMVSNSKIIETIGDKAKEQDFGLVVDPVMVAADGSRLLEEEAVEEMKNFLTGSELVTPNTIEAGVLAGTDVETVENMKEAAERISELGPEGVLIKGGHLDTEKIINVLFREGEFTIFEEPRVPTPKVHGTGCAFSAAITAGLAKGFELEKAIEEAGDFMVDSIRGRLSVGGGSESVNPMARYWKVTSGSREIEEVQRAAKELVNSPEFARLIPEVGTNVAMAPEGARGRDEVVGLTGRIIKVDGRPYLGGVPAPGGSEHVANIIITARKYDPSIRAAMNVRYSERILEKCRELDLGIQEFDRENEPPGVKTMEWGTERAIEKAGGVPNLIYDEGSVGKEPMIRILGEKATEVGKTALRIAEII